MWDQRTRNRKQRDYRAKIAAVEDLAEEKHEDNFVLKRSEKKSESKNEGICWRKKNVSVQ